MANKLASPLKNITDIPAAFYISDPHILIDHHHHYHVLDDDDDDDDGDGD